MKAVVKACLLLALAATASLSIPIKETETPIAPILTPSDAGQNQAVPEVDESGNPDLLVEDHTEFPVLTPSKEEFVIPRPAPGYEEGTSTESSNESDADADLQIERPYPTGEPASGKIKRSLEDDEDDTVVVTAASCGELLEDCKEKNDILSCQTYNEECESNEADEADFGIGDCPSGICL